MGLYYVIALDFLFGDTMVPNIELDYILLLGYSISYKDIRFNHQKNTTHLSEGFGKGYAGLLLRNLS